MDVPPITSMNGTSLNADQSISGSCFFGLFGLSRTSTLAGNNVIKTMSAITVKFISRLSK